MTRRQTPRRVELPRLPGYSRRRAEALRQLQRHRQTEALARAGAVLGFALATAALLVGIARWQRHPGAVPASHTSHYGPSPALTCATVAPLLP